MEVILRDNVKLHTSTNQLNERMVNAVEKLSTSQEYIYTLERISVAIEKLNENHELESIQRNSSRDVLIERLDLLIEKIGTTNNTFQQREEEALNIESELKKRKEAVEKLTRNQEISKYYEALLDEPEPFVRREFRTRVNRTTTERELVHRRTQAMERVRTEIKVMQDRTVEYLEKKAAIDQRIEEYIANHEEKRAEIEQRVTHQDRSVKEIFDRNTMAKLKKTDDEEKMNSYEYLITVAENDSLNYRGQSSRSRRRPGRRGPRQQGY